MPPRKWFEISAGAMLPSSRIEGTRLLEMKNPNGPLGEEKNRIFVDTACTVK